MFHLTQKLTNTPIISEQIVRDSFWILFMILFITLSVLKLLQIYTLSILFLKPLNLFNVFIVQCQNVAPVKVTDSKQTKVAGNIQFAISYIDLSNNLPSMKGFLFFTYI